MIGLALLLVVAVIVACGGGGNSRPAGEGYGGTERGNNRERSVEPSKASESAQGNHNGSEADQGAGDAAPQEEKRSSEPVPAYIRDYLDHPKQLRLSNIRVGDFGDLGPFTVQQVIDDGALVHAPSDEFGESAVLLIGINTGGMVDGKTYSWSSPFRVSGTTRYTTVLGGTRTVFVLKPVSSQRIENYRTMLAEKQAAAERRRSEASEKDAAEKLAALRKEITSEELTIEEVHQRFSGIAKQHEGTASGDRAKVESDALSRFRLAQSLMEKNDQDGAEKWLKRTVDESPDTFAAERAREMLDELR